MAGNALAIDRVTLSFGGLNALSGVSLSVWESTIHGVIGPNGAGKTSLLNCLGGFYRPQQGTIRFLGADVTGMTPDRRASLGMARTFQNIALFKGMTVQDNIKLGAHAHLRTGVLSALLYAPSARREEAVLREEIERDIIDFLEIEHIRRKAVERVNEGLSSAESIRKFRLLEKELDHDDNEVTATMKVRRKIIYEKFAPIIREIYG